MFPTRVTNCNPGILCIQHCTSKIFSFNLPKKCPACNKQLFDKDLLPFQLPYPFVKANQYPCSIVLRPTNGDFLNDYNNSMDLHIAVTTSNGNVVEFDQNGLQRTKTKENSNWSQSLLVESFSEPWYDLWDSVLDQVSQQKNWTIEDYNEDTHNCYTFVLKFLQTLNYDQKLTEISKNKMKFCEYYIVPKTIIAGKYISLYRRIRDDGIYIHSLNNGNGNNYEEYCSDLNNSLKGLNLNERSELENNSDKSLSISCDTKELCEHEAIDSNKLNNICNTNRSEKFHKLCKIKE